MTLLRSPQGLAPPEGLSDAILEAARNAGIGVAVAVREHGDIRTVWMNEVAAAILGRPPEEVLGRTVFAFIAPEEVARIQEISAARDRGEDQPLVLETVLVRGDGSRVAVQIALCVVELAGRRTSITFVIDISPRRATETALRESEARLRRVIEAAPDAIMISRDERVLFANRITAELLAFESPEQLIGVDLATLVRPDDLPAVRERLRAVAESGRSSTPREYLLRARDGRDVRLEISSHALEYDGAPALLAFGRDVSERVRMQEQLARADRLAALGTLAAGVAHEINNPLAFVTLGIDTLEAHLVGAVADPALRAELVARLEPIRTGAARVAEIVRDLKAFSRDDAAIARDIDVASVIRAAERIAGHEVRRHGRLQVSIEGAPRGHGHPGRLEQVLVNLLVNAAHAYEPTRSDGAVELRAVARGDWVEIEVEDHGAGIPPQLIDRVFEPFFTTKPLGLGTGLGLPICHSIVSGMGGTIAIESALGRGTIVRVRIPAARGERATLASERQPASDGRRLRVLIVDDEPALARMLELLLAPDHDVAFAGDGAEALERLARDRFDVVLCDVTMPRMGGRELHVRIAEQDLALASRFVFMTGGALDGETGRWLESISSPRLWKPFSRDALLDALRRVAAEVE